MTGQLFTQYFLTDGIKATDEWTALDAQPEAFAAFKDAVLRRYETLGGYQEPAEAVTEQELIRPVLELLGWTDYLPQQGAARNEDIPDLLLFADADSKARAAARSDPDDRYRDALVVGESKRLGRPLDTRDGDGRARAATPHGQVLRYLSTAEGITDGRLRWGILTDGRVWRLYDHRTRPRATAYYQADLADMLQPGNQDALRSFYLLFRRDSFVLQQGATATFLEAALAEGRRYEQQVAQDLSSVVFERAFPSLVEALADAGGADLQRVRQAALVLLYRLLFVLYAEDRGLLPVNDSRYDDYGLRKRVRDDIARRMSDGDAFSTHAASYYDHLMTLCKLIDKGDASIGLPPYNGGLFAPDAAPLLESARLPDAAMAPIVHDLSHTEAAGGRRFVNYRDMSVQQLGSIYERLLERAPVRDERGAIVIRPNPYARKDSGSFYTPQELVDLIVDRTLSPLAEERLEAFEDKAKALASDRRPKTDRQAELRGLDPAAAVLDLKVLDPAMGSGHFLVTAVDFLSDYIADLVEYAPVVPEWLDGDYESPLVARVAAIRRDLLERAQESGWVMDKAQLSDQTIIRRMVLKRCIYGVDKNPMAVELAKVSLWLHSFTVGAPLSFLDHHLRRGDSLLGLRVLDAQRDFERLGGLSASSAIAGAEAATAGMRRIEELSDADVAEVEESAGLFQGVERTTADLRGVLDFLCGMRWQTAGLKKRALADVDGLLAQTLGRQPSIAYKLLAHGAAGVPADTPIREDSDWSRFVGHWDQARSVAHREGFLHWEAAFPGVWHHWQSFRPAGGFDAVIGNPPWDRIKLQEVEWFAIRDPAIARAPTAAARKAAIQKLRAQAASLAPSTTQREAAALAPSPVGEGRGEGIFPQPAPNTLLADYDAAKERAESLSRLIRASGHYPLLGGGDINLYSLFVERALGLIKPDGFVGLLTPSGIYADKTAADFFKTVSTGGRVGGLFDFENRRLGTRLPPFFPDIDSRFKFCALIVGGAKRRFDQTKCAFFLHDTSAIKNPDRCFPLAPADFARVNPNTGTAPVFRTRRDAEITRGIYERHPVLVDRSSGEERRAWPVKYVRMFDMTNDSHLFRSAAQLEDEGFYPVQGNRWKKRAELYLPLYEGKMVQAFDHRAASVVVNPENLNRPAQPREATLEEHGDPNWLPAPQFWVDADTVEWPEGFGWAVAFKDVTAPTNVRTMIASLVPRSGVGNTLPLLMPDTDDVRSYQENAWLWTPCLNSFALDFIARQKVQGQHLNWFVVEQLPVLTPDAYDRRFGAVTARELVHDHVLRLTYTAHDMAPFARDLGYGGPPFVWDEEERRHLRARLDALYFHLYGLSRDDAGYVLSTFPIVRREDEAAFGRYRTRDLILTYMNALSAGDTETVVAV